MGRGRGSGAGGARQKQKNSNLRGSGGDTAVIEAPSRLSRDEDGLLIVDGGRSDQAVHEDLTAFTPTVNPMTVEAVHERTEVPVSWQDAPLVAESGDLLLTGEDGGVHPIKKDLFDATYSKLPDGRFSKSVQTQAVRIDEPFAVDTLEGRAEGKAGDWLAQGAGGEAWPIPDATFRKRYAVGADDRPESAEDAANTAAATAAHEEHQADVANDRAAALITAALADDSLSHAELMDRVAQALPGSTPEERQQMLDKFAFAAEDAIAQDLEDEFPVGSTNPYDAVGEDDDDAAAAAFARAAEAGEEPEVSFDEDDFDLDPEPEVAAVEVPAPLVAEPKRNHGVAETAEHRRRPTPKQVSQVGSVFADSSDLDDHDTGALIWHEMQAVNAVTREKLGKNVLPTKGEEAAEFILDAVSYVHNKRDADPSFDIPTDFKDVFVMFNDVQKRRKEVATHGAATREAVIKRDRAADIKAGKAHHIAADLPEDE